MDKFISVFLLVTVCTIGINAGTISFQKNNRCHKIHCNARYSNLMCYCVHDLPPCPEPKILNLPMTISKFRFEKCIDYGFIVLYANLNISWSEIDEIYVKDVIWSWTDGWRLFPLNMFEFINGNVAVDPLMIPSTSDVRVARQHIDNITSWQTTPRLQRLNVHGSYVGTLEIPFALQLKELHVQKNQISESVVKWSFFKQLQHVNLSYNDIEDLSTFPFNQLEALQVLDLSHNKIKQFDICSPNLILLSLSDNQLDTFGYKHCENVLRLHLDNNIQVRFVIDDIDAPVHLQELHLQRKSIHTSDMAWQNVPNLHFLNLSDNLITDLAKFSLHELIALEVLDLSRNALTNIDYNCCSHVKELRLTHNRFTKFSVNGRPSWERLYLDYNQIVSIQGADKITARELNIGHNQFILVVAKCSTLFELNMSHNRLYYFDGVYNNTILKRLNLSHNRISVLWDAFTTLTLLEHLDISYNQIYEIHLVQFYLENRNSLQIDLSRNKIRSMDSTYFFDESSLYDSMQNYNNMTSSLGWPTLIRLNGNPLNCDDSNLFWMLQNFNATTAISIEQADVVCAEPEHLKGKRFVDLRPDQLWRTFIRGCPLLCACHLETYTGRMVVNCSGTGRTEVPSIPAPVEVLKEYDATPIQIHPFSLEVHLILDNNHISRLPDVTQKASLPSGYEYVQWLSVNDNNISAISARHISDSMTLLSVENNKLTSIDLSDMPRTLTNLSINGNPIECDCHFQQMVLKHAFTPPACANGRQITAKDKRQTCLTERLYTVGIPVLLALCVAVAIVVYVIYRCASSRTKSVLRTSDAHCKYDVFLCYQSADERFVVNEIMFQLERGPPALKLCVHERDWLGGLQITQAIAESVAASRRMVFVLTRNFLTSRWTRMEFLLAHKRALVEKRTRVIVVLHGDRSELMQDPQMYEEIRFYLKKGEYFKWGEPHFWKRLRAAIDTTTR